MKRRLTETAFDQQHPQEKGYEFCISAASRELSRPGGESLVHLFHGLLEAVLGCCLEPSRPFIAPSWRIVGPFGTGLAFVGGLERSEGNIGAPSAEKAFSRKLFTTGKKINNFF